MHVLIQKLNNKLCMKAINYACFKLEEKATRSGEKNKNNFINVIGDKNSLSIRSSQVPNKREGPNKQGVEKFSEI